MMLRHGLSALLLAWAGLAAADATVPICYGYGCIAQAPDTLQRDATA